MVATLTGVLVVREIVWLIKASGNANEHITSSVIVSSADIFFIELSSKNPERP